MKSKRRWLAGILSVVMTMAFMPAYAFAGEAAESGNNKDATWKVVIDDGDPELWCYYYDTLQEAMDHEYGSGDAQIILNRDASGKGGIGKDGQDYNINFNGHTYTVTEGVEDEEAGTTAIKLKDGYSCYFTNGTLKIKNCSV